MTDIGKITTSKFPAFTFRYFDLERHCGSLLYRFRTQENIKLPWTLSVTGLARNAPIQRKSQRI